MDGKYFFLQHLQLQYFTFNYNLYLHIIFYRALFLERELLYSITIVQKVFNNNIFTGRRVFQGKVHCGRSSFSSDIDDNNSVMSPDFVTSVFLSLTLSRVDQGWRYLSRPSRRDISPIESSDPTRSRRTCSSTTPRRLEKLSLHGLSTIFDNTEEGNLREDSIGCTVAWWLRNVRRGKREKKKRPYAIAR